MAEDRIESARRTLTDGVIDLPGVVGVGVGECDGAPCLRVFVDRLTAELEARIPAEVEGVPVEIDETGEIRPLESGN